MDEQTKGRGDQRQWDGMDKQKEELKIEWNRQNGIDRMEQIEWNRQIDRIERRKWTEDMADGWKIGE